VTTIRLTGADINGDSVSCTVEQLLVVLEELGSAGDADTIVWYAADMDPALGELEPYAGPAAEIGNYAALLALLRGLKFPQIDFGLLIAISETSPGSPVGMVLAADGPSGTRWPNSAIELLAFDDTFIEVTTNREHIVERLRVRFPAGRREPT